MGEKGKAKPSCDSCKRVVESQLCSIRGVLKEFLRRNDLEKELDFSIWYCSLFEEADRDG